MKMNMTAGGAIFKELTPVAMGAAKPHEDTTISGHLTLEDVGAEEQFPP